MQANNKSAYIWILVVLVLGFFAYTMWKPMSADKTSTTALDSTEQTTQPGSVIETDEQETMVKEPDTVAEDDEKMAKEQTEETATGNTKEFALTAANFSFNLKEIRVKKGDTVKITFTNNEGFHDWKLDEFNAETKVLKVGESETITFVADKTGTFEYYCSVGQHRANGMKGNFIVE